MQRSKRSARFAVTGDGKGLTSRSGTAAVRELADRIGMTAALSQAARPSCPSGVVHDPGAVLRDLVVTLVDGGDDFSAIEVLRGQDKLVGEVASDSTAWRRVKNLADDELALARLETARRVAREHAWDAGGAPAAVVDPTSGPLLIDLDATLVTSHSDDKEQTAGTYKGGYGFHPLLAYLDRGDGVGEALAGLLRPGNAGANTAADHVEVFESALAQLPPLPEATRVVVRADSGGSAKDLLWHLHDAGVEVSVSMRLSPQIRAAIEVLHRHSAKIWTPALTQDGQVRDGAHVTEATAMVDLDDYPPHSRLIIRREPLHPGAQQTFDDIDGYRFTCMLTTQPDDDALLDQRHRGHARVEQRIRDGKDTGMANLPSAAFHVNEIWLQLVLCAQDLLAFFAVLALDGDLAVAEPKTIRYRLLHVAGKITTSARRPTLHLDHDWPWLHALLSAFGRIRALPPPLPA